jgi:DNA-binding response OmpR family regulator
MTCILVVDDERDLVWSLQHSLGAEGYNVLTAYDGLEALSIAWRQPPDLIVLDVVMPGMDGLTVCQRLRQDPILSRVPILFLTMRCTVEARVEGLDRGADDYLTKPFNLTELKARVRTLLRRDQQVPKEGPRPDIQGTVLRVGRLALDLHTRQAHVDGKVEQLTPIEFDLLRYLMTHRKMALSCRQLLQEVWNYSPGAANPSLVRWHIKNLREKIEPEPAHPTLVRTLPHHGYMLDQ